MKNLKIIIPVLLLIGLFNRCTYEAVDEEYGIAEEMIIPGSELFQLIERMIDDGEETKPINCIDFIYPISIYTTDNTGQIFALAIIDSNIEFRRFLDHLSPGENISISYPIEATLLGGGHLDINDNAELQQGIEACVEEQREEILSECDNSLNSCIWKVGYSFSDSNEYLGASFEGSAVLDFSYADQRESGSWNGLFIEDDLYININLLGTHAAADFFNYNWKVDLFLDDTIVLTHNNRELILNKYCSEEENQCFNLKFKSCELDQNPGYAEFILNNYKSCINEIMRLDSTQSSLSFYLSQSDAENASNPIDPSQSYITNSSEDIIYVSVNNGQSNQNEVVEIALIVTDCS